MGWSIMHFPFGGGGDRAGSSVNGKPEANGKNRKATDEEEGQIRSLPVAALRHLCELVRRFNQRSYEQVISFGWESYPRFRRLGLDRLEKQSPEKVRQRCRRVLEVAVRELEPQYPPAVGDVSPIGLLRRHVLEGDTWEVIVTHRQEEELPRLSERTLKNRQHEAYLIILRWAKQAALPEQAQLDLPFHRREQLLRRAAIAGAITIALILAVWGLSHLKNTRNPSSTAHPAHLKKELLSIDPRNVGIRLKLDGPGEPGYPAVKEVIPNVHLPEVGSSWKFVLLLPSSEGSPPDLLLASSPNGLAESKVFLWNPLTRRFLWTLDWKPPKDEIFTHKTLDDDVYDQAWRVSWVLYRSGGFDLGDRIALCYQQFYSPTFIIMVKRATGEVLAHYAHPGQFHQPVLADLSEDGKPEMLWPGTDNALNRPDLVVLEPNMSSGAASTCMWNHRGEGALFRVLLPAVPPLQQFFEDPRLDAHLEPRSSWSAEKTMLNLRTTGGGDGKERAYMVHLLHGCERMKGHTIVLDDHTDKVWTRLKLDPAAILPRLEEEIEVVKGPHFAALMGPVLSQRK